MLFSTNNWKLGFQLTDVVCKTILMHKQQLVEIIRVSVTKISFDVFVVHNNVEHSVLRTDHGRYRR